MSKTFWPCEPRQIFLGYPRISSERIGCGVNTEDEERAEVLCIE